MKNIFILPTDQPSRLYYHSDNILRFISDNILFTTSQHIYITSDEEIKSSEIDTKFCIFKSDSSKIKCLSGKNHGRIKTIGKYYEIILTTNPTLIADGVQAIDDEFLEWFVKNPNCEFVEVKIYPLTYQDGITFDKMEYQIIIPQEELKQDETGKWFADNADLKIIMERPNEERYSEDEVKELIIKALTHDDYIFCGALVTVEKEIRTANFNIWFEEYKK